MSVACMCFTFAFIHLYLLAKPIDLLAKYVTAEEDEMDMDIEMNEPYTILNVC